MKSIFKTIISTFCVCLLFSGCQSTPDDEYVIAKNEGMLESKINQEFNQNLNYQFPKNIEEEIYKKDEEYSIIVSAEVIEHTEMSYSVYSIVPDNFNQSEVNTFVKFFFGNQPLFDNYEMSQEMLQDKIVELKAELERIDADNPDDLAAIQWALEQYKKEYQTAPKTVEKAIISSDLTFDPEMNCEILWAYSDLGYNELSRINVTNQSFLQVMTICLDNSRYFLSSAQLTEKAENQLTTPDEAQKIGTEIVAELGIEGMAPIKVEVGITEDGTQQGYIVTFRRSVNSIPVALPEILNYSASIPDMSAKWPSDKLQVRLDDDGVSAISWEFKGKILEELTSNVELLPFDEIYKIAKQQLKNKYAWIETSDYDFNYERIVHVDRIVLEYTCAQEKDKPGYYLLVPAWNFYGGNTLRLENGQTQEEQGMRTDICILSLNAVDGSVIGG